MAVPEILLSGDHAKVARWRRERAIERTACLRPDLLDAAGLTPEERALASDALASDSDTTEGILDE
jgi:tRNA (guanine37-N1)-methyltransferase